MSAREIIRLIEALPEAGQREVFEFVTSKQSENAAKAAGQPMTFQEAKKHVFTTYRDVLEKLAK